MEILAKLKDCDKCESIIQSSGKPPHRKTIMQATLKLLNQIQNLIALKMVEELKVEELNMGLSDRISQDLVIHDKIRCNECEIEPIIGT